MACDCIFCEVERAVDAHREEFPGYAVMIGSLQDEIFDLVHKLTGLKGDACDPGVKAVQRIVTRLCEIIRRFPECPPFDEGEAHEPS